MVDYAMTDAEIYLKAAEEVGASKFDYLSCTAISEVSNDSGATYPCAARTKYAHMFGFSRMLGSKTKNEELLWDMDGRARKALRILLLCMAAAIEQQGGL